MDGDDLDSLLADLETESATATHQSLSSPSVDLSTIDGNEDPAVAAPVVNKKQPVVVHNPFDDNMQQYIDEMASTDAREVDVFAGSPVVVQDAALNSARERGNHDVGEEVILSNSTKPPHP